MQRIRICYAIAVCVSVTIFFICIHYFISLAATAIQSAQCATIEEGVSDSDKETIVNKHNELRKLIANGKVPGQPRGTNLKRMVWDDYLASKAQIIAKTCEYEHKKVYDKRWVVGQNLYRQYSSKIKKGTVEWSRGIQAWFDEYKLHTFSEKFIFHKPSGHYTQVVWATTTHVGCGYTHYPSGNRYYKLYVCNYGPAGNLKHGSMYIVGNSGCENLC